MSYNTENLIACHKACSGNRQAVDRSITCGCFYCLALFPASQVREYVEPDDALCPHCGIDSVLPDAAVKLDANLLEAMHKHWFAEN